MKAFLIGAGLCALAIAATACSDDEEPNSAGTGSPGSGGTGNASSDGGAGASGGNASGANGGGGAETGGDGGSGGGGQVACGGLGGLTCGETEWCDYPRDSFCGGDDSTGICMPKPDACPEDCPGVCACDGMFYCNACMANAAGFDESAATDCMNVTCSQASDNLANLAGGVTTCTTVVRLDYQSFGVLGFQVVCSPYAAVNESMARSVAQADTGYGQAGTFLSGPSPEDQYVFYESPGDFGGAAAVNARNGHTVFGGGIVWDGAGDLVYPASWLPAAQLGPGCPTGVTKPQARGFDFSNAGTLDTGEVDAALDVVWTSALPDGLGKVSYIFDAVVLLYPRTVGAFDPSTAEWIVLVNSGYLE